MTSTSAAERATAMPDPITNLWYLNGYMPVQAAGTLADGRAFYFRARRGVELYVGPVGTDPADLRTPVIHEDTDDAGWMERDDALTVLTDLARRAVLDHPA